MDTVRALFSVVISGPLCPTSSKKVPEAPCLRTVINRTRFRRVRNAMHFRRHAVCICRAHCSVARNARETRSSVVISPYKHDRKYEYLPIFMLPACLPAYLPSFLRFERLAVIKDPRLQMEFGVSFSLPLTIFLLSSFSLYF